MYISERIFFAMKEMLKFKNRICILRSEAMRENVEVVYPILIVVVHFFLHFSETNFFLVQG